MQIVDFAKIPIKILRVAFFARHPRAQRRILAKNACSRMTIGIFAPRKMTLGVCFPKSFAIIRVKIKHKKPCIAELFVYKIITYLLEF